MPTDKPSNSIARFARLIGLTVISFAAVMVGFPLIAIGASDGNVVKVAIGVILVFAVLAAVDFVIWRSYRQKINPDGTAGRMPLAPAITLNAMVLITVVGIIWQIWRR